MSDGIFVDGKRPKSKKALKEALKDSPDSVRVEITSLFSPQSGRNLSLSELNQSTRYDFVGPDPYTSRNFYGSLNFKGGKWVAS